MKINVSLTPAEVGVIMASVGYAVDNGYTPERIANEIWEKFEDALVNGVNQNE